MPPSRKSHLGRHAPGPLCASDLLAGFINSASRVAISPTILRRITVEEVRAIEAAERERKDRYLNQQLKLMAAQIKKLRADISDAQAIEALKDAFAEAAAYLSLQSCDPTTAAIPRKLGAATPDFSVQLTDGTLFLEFKGLNMAGGIQKQETLLNDSLKANLGLESQLRAGARLATAETVIQPYDATKPLYNFCSTRMTIETLVAKITNNLKPAQFALGDTVLLVDLGELPLVADASDALEPSHIDPDTGAFVSGELYHCAFGVKGSPITTYPDFPGATNSDGFLADDGILVTHSFVKGLAFLVTDKWYGVFDGASTRPAIGAFFDKLCTATRTQR